MDELDFYLQVPYHYHIEIYTQVCTRYFVQRPMGRGSNYMRFKVQGFRVQRLKELLIVLPFFNPERGTQNGEPR
jgi:hypothetical protein